MAGQGGSEGKERLEMTSSYLAASHCQQVLKRYRKDMAKANAFADAPTSSLHIMDMKSCEDTQGENSHEQRDGSQGKPPADNLTDDGLSTESGEETPSNMSEALEILASKAKPKSKGSSKKVSTATSTKEQRKRLDVPVYLREIQRICYPLGEPPCQKVLVCREKPRSPRPHDLEAISPRPLNSTHLKLPQHAAAQTRTLQKSPGKANYFSNKSSISSIFPTS